MSILDRYTEHRNTGLNAFGYEPTFESNVQRVMVHFPEEEKEITVQYKDGRETEHSYSEFEIVLNQVYKDSKEG